MKYGDSRVICGAHWQGDIGAPRILSGFVMAKLQKNDQYKNEIADAKSIIGVILPSDNNTK